MTAFCDLLQNVLLITLVLLRSHSSHVFYTPAVYFIVNPTVFVDVFGRKRTHEAMAYKMMSTNLAVILSLPLCGKTKLYVFVLLIKN